MTGPMESVSASCRHRLDNQASCYLASDSAVHLPAPIMIVAVPSFMLVPGMGYSVDSKSSLIEERAGKIARQQERLSVVALSLVLSRPSSSPENAVAVPDCADGSRRRALLTQARRSQLPWWRIAGLEQTVSWEVQ